MLRQHGSTINAMKKKIVIITCYKSPDYIRSRVLRAVFAGQHDVEVHVVKNRRLGALRYPEVLWKLIRVRLKHKPNAYLLTFRGQEILPLVRVVTLGRPLWFDEFVPPSYALTEPYQPSLKKVIRKLIVKIAQPLYVFSMHRSEFILTDTQIHAEYSARLTRTNLSKYLAVPVGADETLFKPKKTLPAVPFQVFYYSSDMQPLHGIEVVLDAAVLLSNEPVQFVIAGGKSAMAAAVKRAQDKGANIEYKKWIPFDELSKQMHRSGLALGGPFGGTLQAQHVVTGKTYQSLACGVATLVGESAATSEVFVDKKNALVVPQQNAQELADAIRWASSHPQELGRIATAGRTLYETTFSTVALGAQVRPLIDSILP